MRRWGAGSGHAAVRAAPDHEDGGPGGRGVDSACCPNRSEWGKGSCGFRWLPDAAAAAPATTRRGGRPPRGVDGRRLRKRGGPTRSARDPTVITDVRLLTNTRRTAGVVRPRGPAGTRTGGHRNDSGRLPGSKYDIFSSVLRIRTDIGRLEIRINTPDFVLRAVSDDFGRLSTSNIIQI